MVFTKHHLTSVHLFETSIVFLVQDDCVYIYIHTWIYGVLRSHDWDERSMNHKQFVGGIILRLLNMLNMAYVWPNFEPFC